MLSVNLLLSETTTVMTSEELMCKYRDDSELRRKTFTDWWPASKRYLSIDEFVRQGFYCVGQGDKVQCVYCRGYLKAWEQNDDILLEHRKHFPNCPFILEPYKFPEFRDLQARIDSLKDWPKQFRQKPIDLAMAGMFYMGTVYYSICSKFGHGMLSSSFTSLSMFSYRMICQQIFLTLSIMFIPY